METHVRNSYENSKESKLKKKNQNELKKQNKQTKKTRMADTFHWNVGGWRMNKQPSNWIAVNN